jgi:hypothetical protein
LAFARQLRQAICLHRWDAVHRAIDDGWTHVLHCFLSLHLLENELLTRLELLNLMNSLVICVQSEWSLGWHFWWYSLNCVTPRTRLAWKGAIDNDWTIVDRWTDGVNT